MPCHRLKRRIDLQCTQRGSVLEYEIWLAIVIHVNGIGQDPAGAHGPNTDPCRRQTAGIYFECAKRRTVLKDKIRLATARSSHPAAIAPIPFHDTG